MPLAGLNLNLQAMAKMNAQTKLLHGLKAAKRLLELFEARHLAEYAHLSDEITLENGKVVVWDRAEFMREAKDAVDTAINLTKQRFGSSGLD